MKHLISTLFLAFCFTAQANEKQSIDPANLKHPIKPALWKVEGKGLTKPSYLFGTIHSADPRITNLHPDAEAAFNASDHFYAEIDLDPKNKEALVLKTKREDGKTLSESIGPDLTKDLNTALKSINPALNAQHFEHMKTWVVNMHVSKLSRKMKQVKPRAKKNLPTKTRQKITKTKQKITKGKALDLVLFERAKKDKKTLGSLESIDSQFDIFNGLTEKKQISMLRATIQKVLKKRAPKQSAPKKCAPKQEKKGPITREKLVTLYLTTSVTEIGKLLSASRAQILFPKKNSSEQFMKKLLDDRNIIMANTIAKALAEKPNNVHFFAVGAAHYTGTSAVQDLLAKKGYTITPAFE